MCCNKLDYKEYTFLLQNIHCSSITFQLSKNLKVMRVNRIPSPIKAGSNLFSFVSDDSKCIIMNSLFIVDNSIKFNCHSIINDEHFPSFNLHRSLCNHLIIIYFQN